MGARRRPVWRTIARVGGYLLVSVLLILIAAVAGMRILGIEPLVVRTSSMEPTIDAGDLILAKTLDGPIQIGRVYVHMSPESGADTAHRVVEVGSRPGTWITQGDNNPAPDAYELTDADFSREVIGWIPAGGYVNNALANPLVRVLMLTLPLLLLLPILFPGLRRGDRGSVPSGDEADSHAVAHHDVSNLHLSRTDRIVSILLALAAFTVLGACTLLRVQPVVIPPVAVAASVTPGAMGLFTPHQVSTLRTGDVIYLTMPTDFVPTVRVIVPNDPFAPVAPARAGSLLLTSIDVADAAGRPKIAELPEGGAVPTVAMQIPRLGAWLPVFATRGGLVALLVVMGLMAAALLIRVYMSLASSPRRPDATDGRITDASEQF